MRIFSGMGIRSFVAVECHDGGILSRLDEVQGRLSATGASMKMVETENIHITLKFLGEIEDSQVEYVSEVIRGISFEPIEFTVEGVGVFPNMRRPTTIWVGVTEGVSELLDLFNRVNDGLGKLGFERDRRRFHPHLTIARVRGGQNRDRLVEELLDMEETVFGRVRVERIYLKRSVLTPSGPVYTTLSESDTPVNI